MLCGGEDVAYLEVEQGAHVGSVHLLEEGGFTVGRGLENNLVVVDRRASKAHFKVYKKRRGFYVKDLGSSNGTYLNGNKLRLARRLSDGDRIRLGRTVYVFHPQAAPLAACRQAGDDPAYSPERQAMLLEIARRATAERSVIHVEDTDEEGVDLKIARGIARDEMSTQTFVAEEQPTQDLASVQADPPGLSLLRDLADYLVTTRLACQVAIAIGATHDALDVRVDVGAEPRPLGETQRLAFIRSSATTGRTICSERVLIHQRTNIDVTLRRAAVPAVALPLRLRSAPASVVLIARRDGAEDLTAEDLDRLRLLVARTARKVTDCSVEGSEGQAAADDSGPVITRIMVAAGEIEAQLQFVERAIQLGAKEEALHQLARLRERLVGK
ncbi:MAG: FHA domain-containing protein, partial [Planctomycetota bacterium]